MLAVINYIPLYCLSSGKQMDVKLPAGSSLFFYSTEKQLIFTIGYANTTPNSCFLLFLFTFALLYQIN
jgi:hypothetical protein